MNKLFGKGLLTSLAYYAIGGFAAFLAYVVWGHTYVHAPGAYHLVIFLPG